MNKELIQKWSKRGAFLVVGGVTGIVALLAINTYRSMKGLDKIDLDNLKL